MSCCLACMLESDREQFANDPPAALPFFAFPLRLVPRASDPVAIVISLTERTLRATPFVTTTCTSGITEVGTIETGTGTKSE
ncbi:hypothetical protein V6N12_069203 [Hibiscus sabdariffa]|uniref:Uncharacterized protein n=1 Tax=Hibiscus sabdariffa TaxID=183260 RepID=A0ABR2FDL8_9ROSI